ncbi:MAG TPA: nucleotide disphospho-sugar-binding domain-containing protein [Lacunisphaera sp.]|nr:nucleotide disphospho-sugar-binding domain-containing protein [Lacunisphaera sp.]
MVEIANAIRAGERSDSAFAIRFISEGGAFERLITDAGFPVERLEPRITPAQIERVYKLDKGEAFGAAFSTAQCIEKIEGELAFIRSIRPVAIVTGSYVTIPLTHRIAGVPLVWVIQSTWLEGFFKHGAGMTDAIRPAAVRKLADFAIYRLIDLWMRFGLLNPLNRAARHYGVPGFRTMFDYWRGDLNLVAEPDDFTGAALPGNHHFVGPIVARQNFPLPREVAEIPRDRPIVYFAMGSSGTPGIVGNILRSFQGTPYRVIAPIRSFLQKIPDCIVPDNVLVTDWLPALQVNRMADIAVIHGGIGTVMTAALAGTPIVGVPMQPEQSANLAAIARKGFAIRVPKSRDPSGPVQAAIRSLLADETARRKAKAYAELLRAWNGPARAAEILLTEFGPKPMGGPATEAPSSGYPTRSGGL